MNMTGKWEPWYRGGPVKAYGPLDTYRAAEEWLAGLDIEDWGCGYGFFATIHQGGYIGVDGTAGFCDVVADLTEYRSTTPGLMLRGVLDHNVEWRKILVNALTSFTERMVVILFTPPGDTNRIGYVAELDVGDYALPHGDITRIIEAAGCTATVAHYPTSTGYNGETVWTVER